jgi:hypothetical protein
MATTKSTTPRKRTASRTTTSATRGSQAGNGSRANASRNADDSIVARTERTLKQRPYTSAAIATGAVTLAAAVGAAGAYLFARRDKGFKEASGELGETVKSGLVSASETVKGGLSSASEAVKELGQRGSAMFKGGNDGSGSETRTQQQIAEEALTLKETGAAIALDEGSSNEIKAGAIAY